MLLPIAFFLEVPVPERPPDWSGPAQWRSTVAVKLFDLALVSVKAGTLHRLGAAVRSIRFHVQTQSQTTANPRTSGVRGLLDFPRRSCAPSSTATAACFRLMRLMRLRCARRGDKNGGRCLPCMARYFQWKLAVGSHPFAEDPGKAGGISEKVGRTQCSIWLFMKFTARQVRLGRYTLEVYLLQTAVLCPQYRICCSFLDARLDSTLDIYV